MAPLMVERKLFPLAIYATADTLQSNLYAHPLEDSWGNPNKFKYDYLWAFSFYN